MVATISDKLSKEIADQSAQIELISQRLIWGLRGFGDRLTNNSCNIPFTDKTFVKAAEHVLRLVSEMRTSVNNSRGSLMAEMQVPKLCLMHSHVLVQACVQDNALLCVLSHVLEFHSL